VEWQGRSEYYSSHMPMHAWILLAPLLGIPLQIESDSPMSVPAESESAETLAPPVAIPEVEPLAAIEVDADEPSPLESDDVLAEVVVSDPPARESVASMLERRARIGRVHRGLGLATFGAMTGAIVLGTIQYANLYGFFAPLERTRCVQGRAIFSQDACVRTPLPHLITSLTAGGLYYATFSLSFAMPDPVGLDRGNSDSARRLRTHKRLRWVHFSGMAAQMLLGMMIANSERFGLDRSNDFRTLQALATMHLVIGYATYGTLTYAGALMAF